MLTLKTNLYENLENKIRLENSDSVSNLSINNLFEDIEIHKNLNPKIWDQDDELLLKVRQGILKTVYLFKKELLQDNIDIKINDILILGSNANYNYSDKSDLDVHVIVDNSLDCDQNHLSIIYNIYKTLFNRRYNITLNGINLELYIEKSDKTTAHSAGIYSLKSGWINKPSIIELPNINNETLKQEINKWEIKYNNLINRPTIYKITKFVDELYKLRQDAINTEGEYALGNLVFKDLRNKGCLDALRELKYNLISQKLSF